MSIKRNESYTIRLDRDVDDHILPKDFYDIIVHRFLPIISLTYIASIIGIAFSKHDLVFYMFQDHAAYIMALFVVVWVSVPAVTWILLQGTPMFRHVAELWYKILAALMVLTIAISFFLFPEADIYGLRTYFIMSVPVFVVIYFFFVKGGLPAVAAYPLNALGFCALLYGAFVNMIF